MISIRLVQPSEYDEAARFIRRIFPEAAVQIGDWDTVLLAENEERPLGFAHIVDDGNRLILQGIGVDESVRGQGVGTMLMEHTLELFEDTDRPIYLKVKVMNPAIDLYSRHGFFLKKFGITIVLVKKPNN
ncbi:GNAT family N-acetyltransferase [Candidatus Micrarchaeota archaeon]|nr:GNAT family N-acetyltransferase [Candidatus Micrarchaeota archaeon]